MEESSSCLVNDFIADSSSLIMITRQETFSVLAKISWDVKTRLHFAGKVQWITRQQAQHHPYRWEVRVTVRLAGGSKDNVMGVSTKGGGGITFGSVGTRG